MSEHMHYWCLTFFLKLWITVLVKLIILPQTSYDARANARAWWRFFYIKKKCLSHEIIKIYLLYIFSLDRFLNFNMTKTIIIWGLEGATLLWYKILDILI